MMVDHRASGGDATGEADKAGLVAALLRVGVMVTVGLVVALLRASAAVVVVVVAVLVVLGPYSNW